MKIHTIVVAFLLLAPTGNGVGGVSDRETIVKLQPNAEITELDAWMKHAVGSRCDRRPLFSAPPASTIAAGFDRVYVIRPEPDRADEVRLALARRPDVEYADWNHRLRLDGFTLNDSLASRLYWIARTDAITAWDIQTGTPSVLIGLVDSGIDYSHPDLLGQLWQNPGETGLDDFGRDRRTNGIDDDGNGFTDDWRGWDFVDAPDLGGTGDDRDPDNDPMDELGHGTAVAGVLGAKANNGSGVAGMAFGCRVMNLRAGGSSGFIEEDDAAQAIVYAVLNGARVINLSFGDVEYMPLLHDAIRFAHARGVVVVASAGNSNSSAYHYPSGFDETISVAATDENDFRASFSNYGASIDAAAPGVDVWTTQLGGGFAAFSGTSFSAPLVSGLAALLASEHPAWSADEIRSVISTSADDIGNVGWDPLFGAGRIHAARALQVPYGSVAAITKPETETGTFADTQIVMGTAAGPLVERFEVLCGVGDNPSVWTLIASVDGRQIVDDTLAIWPLTGLSEGSYALRLTVYNKDGSWVDDRNRFFIDRTPPVWSGFRTVEMIEGAGRGQYVEFGTDDLCASNIWLRQRFSTGPFVPVPVSAASRSHGVFLKASDFPGEHEFFVRFANRAGQETVEDNGGTYFTMDLSDPLIETAAMTEDTASHLPAAYLMNRLTDLDRDGRLELLVNELSQTLDFTTMKAYEYDPLVPGLWRLAVDFGFNGLPRDVHADTATGISNLLVGAGRTSFIFRSPAPDMFPTLTVFSDTNDFWVSRFFTGGDGLLKMIARQGSGYQVWTETVPGSWSKAADLTNPSSGGNLIVFPGSALGDFDGDGRTEIVLGDYDGDVFVYEENGAAFDFVWQERLPEYDANAMLASGDFDGDGRPEFVVGTHTFDITGEGEADKQYWFLRMYMSVGPNLYQAVWEQSFYGFYSLDYHPSGVNAGDVDGDGRDELLLSLYPNVYVFQYDAVEFLRPSWVRADAHSNTIAVGDADGGVNELYVTDAAATRRFVTVTNEPLPPVGFDAVPLDTSRVRLSWRTRAGADGYRMYRGTSDTNLVPVALLAPWATDTTDAGLIEGQSYRYAITSLSGSSESRAVFSSWVRPNRVPFVTGASSTQSGQVLVRFSESMQASSLSRVAHYRLDDSLHPVTAIPANGGQEVLLTLSPLEPGWHTLYVSNVADLDRTEIDSSRNRAELLVESPVARFYLEVAEYLGSNRIGLRFSAPVSEPGGSSIANYAVEPGFSVASASVDTSDRQNVYLQVADGYAIGATGVQYLVIARNLVSTDGRMLDESAGNRAALLFRADNLKNVYVYPNPCRASAGEHPTFANLTSSAVIRIYSMEGRFVRRLTEDNRDGGVTWDLRDEQGRAVPSGIYVFEVESGKKKKRGKFAVVR